VSTGGGRLASSSLHLDGSGESGMRKCRRWTCGGRVGRAEKDAVRTSCASCREQPRRTYAPLRAIPSFAGGTCGSEPARRRSICKKPKGARELRVCDGRPSNPLSLHSGRAAAKQPRCDDHAQTAVLSSLAASAAPSATASIAAPRSRSAYARQSSPGTWRVHSAGRSECGRWEGREGGAEP